MFRVVAEGRGEAVEGISSGDTRSERFGSAVMEVSSSSTTTAVDRSFARGDTDNLAWEKLEAIVRLSYGIGEEMKNFFI